MFLFQQSYGQLKENSVGKLKPKTNTDMVRQIQSVELGRIMSCGTFGSSNVLQKQEIARSLINNDSVLKGVNPAWYDPLQRLGAGGVAFYAMDLPAMQSLLNNIKCSTLSDALAIFTNEKDLKRNFVTCANISLSDKQARYINSLQSGAKFSFPVNGETRTYMLVAGATPDGSTGKKHIFELMDFTKLTDKDKQTYDFLYEKAIQNTEYLAVLQTGANKLNLTGVEANVYVANSLSQDVLLMVFDLKAKNMSIDDIRDRELKIDETGALLLCNNTCIRFELAGATLEKIKSGEVVTSENSHENSEQIRKNYFEMSSSERRALLNTYFGPGADSAFGSLLSNIFSDYLAFYSKTSTDPATAFMQNTLISEARNRQQTDSNASAAEIAKKRREESDEHSGNA